MNIWAVIFICGLAVGLFIVSLFVLNHRKYPRQAFNVVGILVVLCLMITGELLEELSVAAEYPLIIAIGLPLDLLIWALALRYLYYVTDTFEAIKNKWVLLGPFVLILIGQFYFYDRNGGILEFYHSKSSDVLYLVGFKLISTVVFLGYVFRTINKGISTLKKDDKVEFLVQIRRVFIGISMVVGCIYLLFFNTYFELFTIPDSDRIGSLLVTISLYAFGYLVFSKPLVLYDIVKEEARMGSITISSEGLSVLLNLDTISWIESDGNYLLVHTYEKSYKVRSTFLDFMDKLDSRFLRIHRSYVINRDFVKHFQHWRRGEYLVTLKDGKNLSSSRTYKNSIDTLLVSHSVTT